MKIIKIFIVLMFIANVSFSQNSSIYNFSTKTISGEDFSFSTLKGKKVLIVNTASKCGYTPQYEQLESVFEKYGSDNFVIIGFPSNDFLKQEPGSNDEIAEFCKKNYGVTFQMMTKIHVKGKDINPIYKWLTSKELNGFKDSNVKWNFQKYFINEEGKLIAIFPPKTKPNSDEIIKLITN